MDRLFLTFKKKLVAALKPGSLVLVGYSGGPDSTALVHLLRRCQREHPFVMHWAHVDHGWRAESALEAEQIAKQAQEWGVPFHSNVLNISMFDSGSWEEKARDLRGSFFARLYKELGASALVLGHQADDQAEVVLKRIFEGGSIPVLGGMQEISWREGACVWRPLLFASKSDILQWLSVHHIPYFLDPTNLSEKFLRGRMRTTLVPQLSAVFGKEISRTLCRLGAEAAEVKEFFDLVNQPLLDRISPEGILDLAQSLPLPSIQLRYLLRQWASSKGVVFSHQILLSAIEAVLGSCREERVFRTKRAVLRVRGSQLHLTAEIQKNKCF